MGTCWGARAEDVRQASVDVVSACQQRRTSGGTERVRVVLLQLDALRSKRINERSSGGGAVFIVLEVTGRA